MSLKSNSRFIIVVTVVALAAVGALMFFKHRDRTPHEHKVQTINYRGLPMLGNPHAKHKVLAVEDLKCYGCMMYNNLVYPEIKKNFIDTRKASYHVLLVSFLPGSAPAANAAYCLQEQDPHYFFSFLEEVYADQPPESENWATPARLIKMARKAAPKADFKQFAQCILSNRYYKRLQENLKMAGDLLDHNVRTPSVFTNGLKVTDLNTDAISNRLLEASHD